MFGVDFNASQLQLIILLISSWYHNYKQIYS